MLVLETAFVDNMLTKKAATDAVMKYRVGIVGAAGLGKKGLGADIALALKIPFLQSRDITGAILARDRYDYSSGVQVERFLAASGRQDEILRRTIAQQAEIPEFVTDRTFIDLAAYAICELHDDDTVLLQRIYDTCRRYVGIYTHLFLCPWSGKKPEDNKRRTLNMWYQFVVGAVENSLLVAWGCKFHVLSGTDSARVKEAMTVLKGSK